MEYNWKKVSTYQTPTKMIKITDFKTAKAILTKICLENEIDAKNVWVNPDHKYIENVVGTRDVDFLKTKWYGITCQVRYVGGCFYPYIFLI